MYLRLFPPFLFFLLIFFRSDAIEVRLLQSLSNVVPGCAANLQVEILNNSGHGCVLVGHLDLPPLWEAIPSNDILLHVEVGQCAIQTVCIRVPESVAPGEYKIAYEVWARDNMNVLDRDTSSIVIGENRIGDQPIALEITSPLFSEASPDETLFVTALASNHTNDSFDVQLILEPPLGWGCFPSEAVDVSLEPGESTVLIYGVKVPKNALAGEHVIIIKSEADSCLRRSIVVRVASKIDVSGLVYGLGESFHYNQQVQLYIHYTNQGNVPLKVLIDTDAQPACPLKHTTEPFEIPPYGSCEIPIAVSPESCFLEEYTQFLLVKLIDVDSGEQLYQNPMTLKFVSTKVDTDDPNVRIPAHFSMMALGDRYKNILAAEYGGGGVIDAEKERSFEFLLRVPTDCHRVLYNVDQCLYAGMFDKEWNILLGDTVYELSPLTQRYRYGRGAGFEYFADNWSGGMHYTQNTLKSECNPRESCCYFEYRPLDFWGISANYLHKVEGGIPTSNMLTLESDMEYFDDIVTEVEVGKNFVQTRKGRDNHAYRLAANGKFWKDSWFSIEKVYAGPEFYGYYNHLHLLSGSIDTPLSNHFRINVNINRFVQNFSPCLEDSDEAIIPRQHQYSTALTYRMNQDCSFALTGMLLRAEDLGLTEQYNFYQKWYGCSLFLNSWGCNFNGIVSFGQQKDYLTHHTTHFLQRYYAYLCRDFSPTLSTSLFYDAGNINYYDTGPWRSAYGASLTYRFAPTGCFDLFMQKVQQNTDMLDMSQVTLNCHYTFKNLHKLQATAQYFKYHSHYPNDTMFLISYTIPFTVPICRRQDVGGLSGIIYDARNLEPVEGALVSCGKNRMNTGANGHFFFPCIPKGQYQAKVEILPDELIELDKDEMIIDVLGGEDVDITIPVTSSGVINGEVLSFEYKDVFSVILDPNHAELISQGGIQGVRVAIASEGEKEIYMGTTNGNGYFSFPKLRPGLWHVRVFTDFLGDLQELTLNDLIVDLRPGEKQFIRFNVKPKTPELHRLESN